ncbi:MAG: hypothetical protein ACE3JQ_02415 [Paenisporosarcina sp.]
MILKDTFATDIHTFLNPNEFANLHTLDGVEVLLIIDDDMLMERKQNSIHSGEGVYNGEKIIHIATSYLGAKPVEGKKMKLDGKLYKVTDSEENEGMLTITLVGNFS